MGPYLIVTGDFRVTGGMDMANYALARHLAGRGVETHLVANVVAPELTDRPNVTFHRVPRPGGRYLLSEPLLDLVGRHWASRLARRGGRAVVNGGNCVWGDINWVHYVHAAFRPIASGSPARRLKLAAAHRRFLGQERKAIRRARIVIANSERTRRDVIERLGVPESRVHTVYYGIDPDRFGPISPEARTEARAALGWPADRPVVVFIGALGDRRKGFDVLHRAWSDLCADPSWDADLVVVGAGAELPAWRDRVASAELAERFRFLGFSGEVPRILAASDALVHPVRYEAYGLGVHEALCRGLPALVSASAGVAERYPDDLRDLLIPDPEDAADLAARLRRWRSDLAGYRARVAELAARLRAYTWDDMASAFLRTVESAT